MVMKPLRSCFQKAELLKALNFDPEKPFNHTIHSLFYSTLITIKTV